MRTKAQRNLHTYVRNGRVRVTRDYTQRTDAPSLSRSTILVVGAVVGSGLMLILWGVGYLAKAWGY